LRAALKDPGPGATTGWASCERPVLLAIREYSQLGDKAKNRSTSLQALNAIKETSAAWKKTRTSGHPAYRDVEEFERTLQMEIDARELAAKEERKAKTLNEELGQLSKSLQTNQPNQEALQRLHQTVLEADQWKASHDPADPLQEDFDEVQKNAAQHLI